MRTRGESQWEQYQPKPPHPGSWLAKQPLSEAGESYHASRQRIMNNLSSGYDIPSLESFRYKGPGEHSYWEHQALITQGNIIEHNEAVDVLKHVHGIDVGAPNYWNDEVRRAVAPRLEERANRGGKQRSRAKEFDYMSRIRWEGE